MFDVVTYALVKKMVGQAATGIAGAEYKDGKLIFTLADGSTLEVPLDISSGVKGARINEENALVIDFSDGTSLTYDAVGNITRIEKGGVVVATYTYDELNNLTDDELIEFILGLLYQLGLVT